ncbi:MAG: 16S rRNA (guanine(966)-N(2))-methyltransferase RsmD [Christensenellaceae bacterium]|nr:16S rRNA (guanine(966)-N(2))-methyltransferase RsmD [Christensenellaceae bacterium]MDD7495460.1 16S rRNA (guanine(966)-N(2))-methyltransferase RsmD [Christensenellaceae bacterium]MDY3976698.1 16S rRNA (guanine(966)-N(2))-methyltransferase RsmD [Eubacteriales bacterium]MDY5718742.1 16S rRNA (guanine(966)-N(2))-methyltransferase RsmD [Eubacteriales bacterium]
MRIIAGSCKGRPILAPKGMDTRPTLDRVKESLFGIIQFQLYGKTVLDLFAGSGNLGLEALSRGASFAAFNDMSRDAVKVIRANIEKLGFEQKSVVMNVDFAQAIRSLSARRFDIVFLDPPYRAGLMEKALRELSSAGILNEGAMVIAEHDAHIAPVDTGALVLYDRRIYRDTALSFYRLEGEE